MDFEKLKELVREEYQVVNSNEAISKVLSMLELEHDKAVLVEEDGKIIGVAREKDLIRGGLMTNPDETKIKNFLVKTGAFHVNELKPEKVARRFIEDSTPFVLVKLNEKFGVIYIDDFLQKLKPEFDAIAKEVMNPEVITVKMSDGVAKALATMREHGISRVVVVDEANKIAGIVTGKDIVDRVVSLKKDARLGYLSKKEKEKTLSIMVEGIMSTPVIVVEKEDTIAEVIDLMVENEISSIVVARNNTPEGIVIKRDILEHYLKRAIPKEYEVQIITKGLVLDDFELEKLLDDLNKFLRRFKGSLGKSHLFVYVKKLKTYYRRIPLIHVSMRLRSDHGVFFVTGETWGVEFAVHAALNKLERQVIKDKELVLDKRVVQRFYEGVI